MRACAERGVVIRTKVPSASTKTAIPKRDFAIDIAARTVTCPEGHTATNPTFGKDPEGGDEPVARFKFDKTTCGACPLKARCSAQTAKGGGRLIVLSPYEPEIQRTKAFNATEAAKPLLRSRSAVERLISHLVRMGMRHARFFGMHMVQFQAYMTAAAYDLQRIIALSAKEA